MNDFGISISSNVTIEAESIIKKMNLMTLFLKNLLNFSVGVCLTFCSSSSLF